MQDSVAPKVIMCAYACQPNAGSEAGVGWNWATQASKHAKVWVITSHHQQASIESLMATQPNANLHFRYVQTPPIFVRARMSGITYRIRYLAWQLAAWRAARDLHSEIRFDFAHHVTFASIRYPTFVAWLGIPYIWGPIGGGERAPLRLYKSSRDKRGVLLGFLREANSVWNKVDPLLRTIATRASRIVTTNPETLSVLPKSTHSKAIVVPAIGLSAQEIQILTSRSISVNRDGPLRLIFVGELTALKGAHLLLPAIAAARSRGHDLSLDILGDGPLWDELCLQIVRYGLQSNVNLKGRVEREVLLAEYSLAQIMLFPAIRESGGFAVLEAMAAGLPVICVNRGGPAILVDERCGIRIQGASPDVLIAELAEAISTCAGFSEEELSGMSSVSRERAIHLFGWDTKSGIIKELYAHAVL